MCEIAQPEGISWETQAIIQNIINEYEDPNTYDQDFDPFKITNPYQLQIIHETPEQINWDEWLWC